MRNSPPADHHKGLLALAHESIVQGGRGTAQSQADAGLLDAKQGSELEQMVTMLGATFQDQYEPKVPPADRAAAETVAANSGPAYASAFYRAVVAHHRRAVTMIEVYLPKAQRAEVRAMAEGMKKDHQADIERFDRRAGTP